jgi:16S rRNA U1498 N3-methylase RsmE
MFCSQIPQDMEVYQSDQSHQLPHPPRALQMELACSVGPERGFWTQVEEDTGESTSFIIIMMVYKV